MRIAPLMVMPILGFVVVIILPYEYQFTLHIEVAFFGPGQGLDSNVQTRLFSIITKSRDLMIHDSLHVNMATMLSHSTKCCCGNGRGKKKL